MKKNIIRILGVIATLGIIVLAIIFLGKEKPKQVILISIDTLRADRMDLYGYNRDTAPHLTALAQDSLYFEEAYTNASWTIPSHVTLLTGTYPSRHGINKSWKDIRKDNQYPQLNADYKNIAEIFQEQGIKTLKFAALPDELGFGRGFDLNRRGDPFGRPKLYKKLMKKLAKYKDDDFFYFIHTWRVHAPYTDSRYLEADHIDAEKRKIIDHFREARKRAKSTKISAEFVEFLDQHELYDAKHCSDLYDGGISYVDEYIDKLTKKLKKLEIYDDVMIIVVSDHGEHFDEHLKKNFYGCHGLDFYEEFIRVPLIIKFPNNEKAGKSNRLVSLSDVPPTILNYYDLEIPNYMQGVSLLEDAPKGKPGMIFSEAISHAHLEKKMIRVGDLKYTITMRNPKKPERVNWDNIIRRRLYDLKKDPLEENNIYENKEYRQLCINFEKMIKKIVRDSANFKKSKGKVKVNQETLDDLESLGYI